MRGALLVLATMIAGCREATTICPADLRVHGSPRDTTVMVGQQFKVSLELFGCAGHERLSDTITFSSSDPATARVDTASGVVSALRPGDAIITAVAHHYGVPFPAQVHIR